jgi:hypothetical protein
MVWTPAVVLRTAAGVAVGAACAYFLWPAPVAMMKAPGAAGLLISRAAFLANPQLYFELLRTAGVQPAVAAFAARSIYRARRVPADPCVVAVLETSCGVLCSTSSLYCVGGPMFCAAGLL